MSQLDLVFICDSTGSMGSYIEAAKKNIQTIIQKIIQFEKADVQFALVEYKDHPPQDHTFNIRVTEFTQSRSVMQEAVDAMRATGGGDTPESICCAFHAAVNLGWREDSTKVIIWIADAPPHGFMKNGDGFPDGCPCGKDMMEEVRNCMMKDIVIYSVGTEPLKVPYLRTFMRAVSQLSNGQYVALSSAELLSEMIINGCREEIQLKKVMMEVRKRLESAEDFNTLSDREKQTRIDREVVEQTKDMQIDTVVVDNIFEEELPPVPDLFLTCQSLRELKAEMYKTPDINAHVKAAVLQAIQSHGIIGSPFGIVPFEPVGCGCAAPTASMGMMRCAAPIRPIEPCGCAAPMVKMRCAAPITPMEPCAAPTACIGSAPPPSRAVPQQVSSSRQVFSGHQQARIQSRLQNQYCSPSNPMSSSKPHE